MQRRTRVQESRTSSGPTRKSSGLYERLYRGEKRSAVAGTSLVQQVPASFKKKKKATLPPSASRKTKGVLAASSTGRTVNTRTASNGRRRVLEQETSKRTSTTRTTDATSQEELEQRWLAEAQTQKHLQEEIQQLRELAAKLKEEKNPSAVTTSNNPAAPSTPERPKRTTERNSPSAPAAQSTTTRRRGNTPSASPATARATTTRVTPSPRIGRESKIPPPSKSAGTTSRSSPLANPMAAVGIPNIPPLKWKATSNQDTTQQQRAKTRSSSTPAARTRRSNIPPPRSPRETKSLFSTAPRSTTARGAPSIPSLTGKTRTTTAQPPPQKLHQRQSFSSRNTNTLRSRKETPKNENQRVVAVDHLQREVRFYRGFAQQLEKEMEALQKDTSSNWWRCAQSVMKTVEAERRNEAVVILQKWWRIRLASQKAAAFQRERGSRAAALAARRELGNVTPTNKSWWRRRMASQSPTTRGEPLRKIELDERRNKAVTILQNWWRTRLAAIQNRRRAKALRRMQTERRIEAIGILRRWWKSIRKSRRAEAVQNVVNDEEAPATDMVVTTAPQKESQAGTTAAPPKTSQGADDSNKEDTTDSDTVADVSLPESGTTTSTGCWLVSSDSSSSSAEAVEEDVETTDQDGANYAIVDMDDKSMGEGGAEREEIAPSPIPPPVDAGLTSDSDGDMDGWEDVEPDPREKDENTVVLVDITMVEKGVGGENGDTGKEGGAATKEVDALSVEHNNNKENTLAENIEPTVALVEEEPSAEENFPQKAVVAVDNKEEQHGAANDDKINNEKEGNGTKIPKGNTPTASMMTSSLEDVVQKYMELGAVTARVNGSKMPDETQTRTGMEDQLFHYGYEQALQSDLETANTHTAPQDSESLREKYAEEETFLDEADANLKLAEAAMNQLSMKIDGIKTEKIDWADSKEEKGRQEVLEDSKTQSGESLVKSQEMIVSLEHEIDELEDEIDEIETENLSLKAKISSLKYEMGAQRASYDAALEEAKSRLQLQSSERADFQHKVVQAASLFEAKITGLENSHKTAMEEANNKISSLEAQNLELQRSQSSCLEEAQQNVARLEAQIAGLQSFYEAALEKAIKTVSSLEPHSAELPTSNSEALEEAKQKAAPLAAQVSDLQSSHEKALEEASKKVSSRESHSAELQTSQAEALMETKQNVVSVETQTSKPQCSHEAALEDTDNRVSSLHSQSPENQISQPESLEEARQKDTVDESQDLQSCHKAASEEAQSKVTSQESQLSDLPTSPEGTLAAVKEQVSSSSDNEEAEAARAEEQRVEAEDRQDEVSPEPAPAEAVGSTSSHRQPPARDRRPAPRRTPATVQNQPPPAWFLFLKGTQQHNW